MTRRQAIFILSVNAVVSLIISLIVVFALGRRPVYILPTPTPAFVSSPSSEASPQPQATRPRTYVVQEGDTLSHIAEKFGVSLEDLMRINAISNPDLIYPGQELLIPGGKLPEPTPTFTLPFQPPTPVFTPVATQPPSPTPIPSPAVSEEGVYIEAIINAGVEGKEAIIIRSAAEKVKNMAGWRLTADNLSYVFPDFLLWPQGAVTLYTHSGKNNPAELYWGLDKPILHQVKKLTLYNREGQPVSSYQVRSP
ncbi:MAG: LysM peptidoglycan-binding domain-containing protein [Anaerolineae bacterium]|nr:LysM peptidoglycan-binding domain-containing protein [Anaerolineae bacterium]MDW8102556.1 LysM peptidoglycan-binding domain-containing protein [Anaerolineae bacterium]